jgi:hypothetical protein
MWVRIVLTHNLTPNATLPPVNISVVMAGCLFAADGDCSTTLDASSNVDLKRALALARNSAQDG